MSIKKRIGQGIFAAYASCVVWAVCVFTHESCGRGGFIGPPNLSMPVLNRYWIVPEFRPAEPLVWWSIGANRWVNAAPHPTLVEIGGGETMLIAPDGIIHHDPDACRAQCGPNECATCWWGQGICFVRCETYSPFNPHQWTDCPMACEIDPGFTRPTMTEPSEIDDDKR